MKKVKVKKIVASMLLSVFVISNANISANAVTDNAVSPTASSSIGSNAQVAKGDLKRKVVGYFPSWAYKNEVQGNFDVADLQWDSLTHIQYSFGTIDEKTQKLVLDDSATKEDFKNYSLNYKGQKVELDPSLPYKGHFNVLQTMKKKYNPNMKLMLSIGGWAGCKGFYPMLQTDAGIETFANSCVDFLKTYNFDGIDIDFEYPSSTATSGNPANESLASPMRGILNERYNLLIKVLREKIDAASSGRKDKYLLTAAVTASAWVLGGVPDNTYANYLDFLSVMSYDFHGGWNQFVENQAAIYPNEEDTETKGQAMPYLNMDWAYRFYRGVLPPEKILMGIPYYTRGWENVSNGGETGLHGNSGSKEQHYPATGIYNLWGDPRDESKPELGLEPAGANPLWHVLNLMDKDPNLKLHWDEKGCVPYVYQNDKKVFLSFENERSIQERVKYIQEKNLGGALIWVMNGDYGENPNYVPGSDNPNEGKYFVGDTLTKTLKNGLDKMGDCKETKENLDVPVCDVDVDFGGKYDHPNYTYNIKVTNNSDVPLKKGFELSFDLPKSAAAPLTIPSNMKIDSNGDFWRVTLTSTFWNPLNKGESMSFEGMFRLCFSGVRNITIDGKRPNNVPVNGNYGPEINGVTDVKIPVRDNYTPFDVLAGVSATDKEDGNLTNKIQVTGKVKAYQTGKYTLTYKVEDKDGLTTIKERVVEVVRRLDAGQELFDNSKDYVKGNQVVYGDALYEFNTWGYNWGETDRTPTNTKYWIKVKDLPSQNLPDKDPDIKTLAEVANKYNTQRGEAAWDSTCDLNSDGIVDLYDLVLAAKSL